MNSMHPDDVRRMLRANQAARMWSLRKRQTLPANGRWSIHLIAAHTVEGSEFELRKDGIPFSGGHLSWDDAYQAIPKEER
jgi:hypothetical protein